MARRKHRRNPRAKYKVRHVVLKKNGARRRRMRYNGPADPATIEAEAILAAGAAAGDPIAADILAAEGGRSEPSAKPKFTTGDLASFPRPYRGFYKAQAKKAKAEEGKQRKRVMSALERAAKIASASAKKAKGATKRARSAQATRLRALAAVVKERGRAKALKSPLVKAMTLRQNPDLGGLGLIVGQSVAATGGFVTAAFVGKMMADALTTDTDAAGTKVIKPTLVKDGKQSAMAKYAPAAGTLVSTFGLWYASSMIKPLQRYQLGIVIGGMSAAILQAFMASDTPPAPLTKEALKAETVAGTVKRSLGLGEYTTVGGGIFHGVGEYTTVGQAHPFRPRNYGDNQMEFAATGGLGALLEDRGGADNATEFAPGEGGIFTKMPSMR